MSFVSNERGHLEVIPGAEFPLGSELVKLAPGADREPIHVSFRYPARFHPPVLKYLIESFTDPGQTILDPFGGSGTLLVEASESGRHAIVSDYDLVAAFICGVKAASYDHAAFGEAVQLIKAALAPLRREDAEYEAFQGQDITKTEMDRVLQTEGLLAPAIPKLLHWFRAYVVVDLCRIERVINSTIKAGPACELARYAFAASIRGCSNADPVPVSGLEVTSHMLKIEEKGRTVNPFSLFLRRLDVVKTAFDQHHAKRMNDISLRAFHSDAKNLHFCEDASVDAVITSPPYHNAVDYYRRHQLEAYWLRLVENQDERLGYLKDYIGRPKVYSGHPMLKANTEPLSPLCNQWESAIRAKSADRANTFRHYLLSMQKVTQELARAIKPQGRLVYVVGKSTWNGDEIPTAELFFEISKEWFRSERCLHYPVLNRYMSYTRKNGASIAEEQVLVLTRK